MGKLVERVVTDDHKQFGFIFPGYDEQDGTYKMHYSVTGLHAKGSRLPECHACGMIIMFTENGTKLDVFDAADFLKELRRVEDLVGDVEDILQSTRKTILIDLEDHTIKAMSFDVDDVMAVINTDPFDI